jgi:hypothetical protein
MLNPIKPRACLTPTKAESELAAFLKFLGDRQAIEATLQELRRAREEVEPIIARADAIAALDASFAERERLLDEREEAVSRREAEAESRWAELRRITMEI